MRKIALIFLFSFLFANPSTIKNLIGEYKFETFKGVLQPIINEDDISQTLKYLLENGLLDLNTNNTPTFHFSSSAPIFDTTILYKTLKKLGFYSFYPTYIEKKESNYTITIKLPAPLNPLYLINNMQKYGCYITDIKKEKNFIYNFNCEDRRLKTISLTENFKKEINAKGIYFINPNGFSKIEIKTSKFDNWYPYVVFYDKNLNIISINNMDVSVNDLILDIPQNCEYIKITDNYTKENFKRGIWIKGLQ